MCVSFHSLLLYFPSPTYNQMCPQCVLYGYGGAAQHGGGLTEACMSLLVVYLDRFTFYLYFYVFRLSFLSSTLILEMSRSKIPVFGTNNIKS